VFSHIAPSLVEIKHISRANHHKSHKRADGITISSTKAISKRAPSQIVVTDVVLPLTRKASTGASAARRSRILSSLVTIPDGSTTNLTSLFIGEEFAAEITIGTTTLELIVDTGSSDTWVVESGFSCIDLDTGNAATEASCEFGPYYTKTSSFTEIAGEEFSIEYGDGEYLTGIMGTESVTVAGLKVEQEIALVTSAAWEGDGTTSGLIGFAYPALQVFNSTSIPYHI
jgi:hypothetical protein